MTIISVHGTDVTCEQFVAIVNFLATVGYSVNSDACTGIFFPSFFNFVAQVLFFMKKKNKNEYCSYVNCSSTLG